MKGYAQQHGIDYDETFVPIAKMAIIRVLLAKAATKGWHLHQIDVKNAFLQGDLGETLYIVQPPGFRLDVNKSGVCRLNKFLYGLKQALRAWNSKIVTQYLHKIGFNASQSDTSLFIRRGQTSLICILLYVDDLVIIGVDLSEVCHVKTQLLTAFETLKDLGIRHYFLGIQVIHTPDGILLTQRHYAVTMLFRFGMTNSQVVSTPLDRNQKLHHDSGSTCDEVCFRQIVGSLIYLTIT